MPGKLNREIIIGFTPEDSHKDRLQTVKSYGGRIIKEIPEIDAFVVELEEQQAQTYISSGTHPENVSYVEVNQEYSIHKPLAPKRLDDKLSAAPDAVPNDPLLPNQWGIFKIRGPQAWDISQILPTNTYVAVLDTGIDTTHPDLVNKVAFQANFTNSPTTLDLYGHGTHVSGIVAAATNDAIGVAGTTFNSVYLVNVKVLNDSGSGFDSWIAQGIIYAANLGVAAINMSLGGSTGSRTLANAVRYAVARGVAVVASAGNSANQKKEYPAAFNNVIAVAATNPKNRKASFSSYGASWVDIASPGVNILSTMPTYPNKLHVTNYGYLSGTSMAAPFVTGVIGLLKATYPAKTGKQLTTMLLNNTSRIRGQGTFYRRGLLNAVKSVRGKAKSKKMGKTRKKIKRKRQ